MHKNGALTPRVRVSENLVTEETPAADELVAIGVHAARDEKVVVRSVGPDDLPSLDPSPRTASWNEQREKRDQGSSETHVGMVT